MADELSILTLGAARAYVNATADALGAVKGAPCTIKSITPITGGNRVTFEWTSDSGVKQTQTMDVMDGTNTQVSTLPEASAALVGTIYQYVGATTATLTKGYFYQCIHDGALYYWEEVPVQSGGGSGSGGELTRTLSVTEAVGGIKVGDQYVAGDAIEDLLHDMLDPVAYPTLTNPSASMSAPGSKVLETGSTANVTMTVEFNRGSISPAYGTSGCRAGNATGYAMNGGTAQMENTFAVTVSASQKTYQATVTYSAGEQPKDSTGANYDSPLPAGSVNTNTISYEFVDALWANTASIDTIAKLNLVSKSAKQKDFVFPAQTIANPEVFDVPASWTVTAVQVKNDLSGQYEDALAQFTVTDTTHDDAAGNSVAYKRYTFNLGYPTGSRTVRLKWS